MLHILWIVCRSTPSARRNECDSHFIWLRMDTKEGLVKIFIVAGFGNSFSNKTVSEASENFTK